jgi:3-dehydroquinate synthase
VFADMATLTTLSERDVSAGLGEVVKHGVIGDPELLALLEERAEEARRPAEAPMLLAELVRRSCALKARVVAADERELSDSPDGGRAKLNFGHTVGHALESASALSADPLRHGEAVGLGMIAAARLGAALGPGDPSLEARLTSLLPRLGLPVDLDRRLDAATLERLQVDKKRTGATLKLVVVDRIGSTVMVPIEPRRAADLLLSGKPR